jgi:5,10-methylenetetrahydromethanopterin reductase
MVKLGVALLGDMPARESAKFAKLAEDCGFDNVWLADESPSSPYRDVFVTLATVASETTTVKIGTGVCNPYSRHPALLAVAISTIHELSNDRAILGLGAGGSLSLKPLGIKLWDRPVATVRETVFVCRSLFRGETLNYDGQILKTIGLKLFRVPEIPIPIYLGAYGPRMFQLAGQVADGVLTTAPLECMSYALENLRNGAHDANRDLQEIDFANWLPFSLSDDKRKAREVVKADVSYMIADFPAIALEKIGVTEEEASRIRGALAEGVTEAARFVTNKMIESCTIAGTPEYCTERIQEYENAGAKQIVLGLPSDQDPCESMKLVKRKIMTRL